MPWSIASSGVEDAGSFKLYCDLNFYEAVFLVCPPNGLMCTPSKRSFFIIMNLYAYFRFEVVCYNLMFFVGRICRVSSAGSYEMNSETFCIVRDFYWSISGVGSSTGVRSSSPNLLFTRGEVEVSYLKIQFVTSFAYSSRPSRFLMQLLRSSSFSNLPRRFVGKRI